MRVPAEGVYRAMGEVHDGVTAGPALIEVIARWGDEVLAVAHLREGERFVLGPSGFAHPSIERDHTLVAHTAAGCLVTPPPGGSGHVRYGASRDPIEGPTALTRAMRAHVALGDLRFSARAVADEHVARKPRWFTAFHAICAALLLLAATAGMTARDATEQPPELSVDDGAAQWLNAHLRPWSGPVTSRKPNVAPVVYSARCGCGVSTLVSLQVAPPPFDYVRELHRDGVLIGRVDGPLRQDEIEPLVRRERVRLLRRLTASFEETYSGVWIDLRVRTRRGAPTIIDARRVYDAPDARRDFGPFYANEARRANASRDTLVRVVLGWRDEPGV